MPKLFCKRFKAKDKTFLRITLIEFACKPSLGVIIYLYYVFALPFKRLPDLNVLKAVFPNPSLVLLIPPMRSAEIISMALRGTILLLLVGLASCNAASYGGKEKKDTEVAPRWNFFNTAALTTAILVVGAGFSALMSLFLPVMTYKLCLMLGGCEEAFDLYVDRFIANEGNSRRQRRSMEYIEPILTTLAEAYEKYADNDLKKKSKRRK